MKRIVAFGPSFVILVLAAFAEGQQSPRPGSPAVASSIHWSGTQQVTVADPAYQMTAYTLAMPSGWHFGGDLVRGGGCHGNSMSLNYMMESPDRLSAVIQLAGVHWHWDNDEWKDEHHMRQCEAVEISSAADFVVNVLLPEVRPNAKIMSVTAPAADQQQALARAEEAERQRYAMWARQGGGQPPEHVYIDAVSVRVRYAINGQPVEEMVSAVIDCYGGRQPYNFHPNYPPVTDLFCSSRPERIVRAPLGQLDALLATPELKQLGQSVQVNAEWWNRYSRDVYAQMFRDKQMSNAMIAASWANFNAQQQASQAFFNQLSENNRVFNQNMQEQGQRNMMEQQDHQALQDAEAHRWINFAGDKADYINSYTGQTVTLSNKYSHTFFSSDGRTAIQSNGFNPNDVPGSGVWTEAPPQ